MCDVSKEGDKGLVPVTFEYKLARRHRLTPIEALEDWDMLYPEDYKLFEE